MTDTPEEDAEKSGVIQFPRSGESIDHLERDVILRALGITDAVIAMYGEGAGPEMLEADVWPTPDALIHALPTLRRK